MNPNIFDELSWRGLLNDVTDREEILKLGSDHSFYIGYDPTAPSLQLGNLVGVIVSIHLAKAGLKPLQLFGGATGAIGDPSGRSSERNMLSWEAVQDNVSRHQALIRKYFERANLEVEFVNNFDWTSPLSAIDFLREVGKYFTVNYMIAKEHVKSRLDGDGLSYTEFSYLLLQSFDFLHLFQHKNCRLQIGGSDQWGNITGGLELIRKKIGGQAYALSFPLITDSNGKKLGKTADGAIWLDPNMTSAYKFHQYFLNFDDKDVEAGLKVFSFLSKEEIQQIVQESQAQPEKRLAQKRLADEICTFVHGHEATVVAQKSAQVLFGGSLEGFKPEELSAIFADVPSVSITKADFKDKTVLELITHSKLVTSKSDGRRMLSSGAIYVNNIRVSSETEKAEGAFAPIGNMLVLRSGKKNYQLIKISD
jgi:tyrosyl-tRNA synthetase